MAISDSSGVRGRDWPSYGTALLTCVDLDLSDVSYLFSSTEGSLIVVSNTGGVATEEVLLSFGLAQGQVGRIVVVQHTGCEWLGGTREVQGLLTKRGDQNRLDVKAFAGVLETVKATVLTVERSLALANSPEVQGYVYDRGVPYLVCL